MEVRFYDHTDDCRLKFAVVIAKYEGKWVFCKHRERSTYELPGGHREPNESIFDAASRELIEETGADEFSLKPICVYSVIGKNRVNKNGEETFGMLYFADIQSFSGKLDFEIGLIKLFDELPDQWTYPEIQPLLIKEYEKKSQQA